MNAPRTPILLLAFAVGCGRIGFEAMPLADGDGVGDSGPTASAPDASSGGTASDSGPMTGSGGTMGSGGASGEASVPEGGGGTVADSGVDADAAPDPCPGDTDVDRDGVCDAVDLEPEAPIADVVRAVVSADERTLFALRADRDGIVAYDIDGDANSRAPVLAGQQSTSAAQHVTLLTDLADGRVLVASQADGSSVVDRIRIYSFDGASFTLDEDISTTSNRVYAAVLDPGADRLYWTDFAADPVHYYDLAATPLGFTGLGSSLGAGAETGTYGLLIDGSYIYKLRSLFEVVERSTGSVVHSFPLDGSHTASGHGNVAKYSDYVLFVDRWFEPIHFTAVDVSDPPAAQQVASLELSNTASPVTTGFAVRDGAAVAIVADSETGLHIVDLSGLPTQLTRIQPLGPAELGGLTPSGKIDCSARCCYADSTAGSLIVLCP